MVRDVYIYKLNMQGCVFIYKYTIQVVHFDSEQHRSTSVCVCVCVCVSLSVWMQDRI